MQHLVVLNNIDHKDLKVKTDYCADYGDNVTTTLAFVNEFSSLSKEYAILMHKDHASAILRPVVMLGFNGINLFLSQTGSRQWHANYVPAYIARGPFQIGLRSASVQHNQESEAIVQIDLNSKRVSFEHGTSVFSLQGGYSAYLQHMLHLLTTIHQGIAENKRLIDAVCRHDLLEPVQLSFSLSNGEEYHLHHYHTVKLEKLKSLNGSELESLNTNGVLQALYLMASSTENLAKLHALMESHLEVLGRQQCTKTALSVQA